MELVHMPILKRNKVLVVAAHPDDEVLGCGGAILKHTKAGDDVTVIIMAEGVTSRDNLRDVEKSKKDLSMLKKVAQKANLILGVQNVHFLGLPDNRMDSCQLLDVVKLLQPYFESFNPNIVYTHHRSDLNVDHKVTHDAVLTVARPQPQESVKEIYFFEVLSSTHWSSDVFSPDVFIDITKELSKKLKALGVYHVEMRKWPHARSIEGVRHLASFRGACVGVQHAEAYELGRLIK